MFKPISKLLLSSLSLAFIVSGCKFLTEGKEKLAHYCPGLKINISGQTHVVSDGREYYVIDFFQSSHEAVKTYFETKENGFTEEKDGDFYNLVLHEEPIIDKADNILEKTYKHNKGNTEVIYDETTGRIIIVENPY